MTPKELKRLSRSDLLEMLLALSKENDQLRRTNEKLQKQLDDRSITIENCGSLAEASLTLNSVFQAAEDACRQYLLNMEQRSAETEEKCRELEAAARKEAQTILNQAREEAQVILAQAEERSTQEEASYGWLKELMDNGETQ